MGVHRQRAASADDTRLLQLLLAKVCPLLQPATFLRVEVSKRTMRADAHMVDGPRRKGSGPQLRRRGRLHRRHHQRRAKHRPCLVRRSLR